MSLYLLHLNLHMDAFCQIQYTTNKIYTSRNGKKRGENVGERTPANCKYAGIIVLYYRLEK